MLIKSIEKKYLHAFLGIYFKFRIVSVTQVNCNLQCKRKTNKEFLKAS